MSYKYGMAALNLKMTDLVPRMEFSAHVHFDLIKKLTGIDGTLPEMADKASAAFMKEWDYSMKSNYLIGHQVLGNWQTYMGHAVYNKDGSDKNSHVFTPFKGEEEVYNFDPFEKIGAPDIDEWVTKFNEDYARVVNIFSDVVNMTGTYATCMSGLIGVFGWDWILTCAGNDPKRFGEMTNRYADWMSRFCIALAKSDAPAVTFHDDIVWTEGAFIHPDWYRKYIFPNYKKMLKPLIESGKKIIYVCDGNYTEFIDDIAECGVSGFILEPTTDMQYIAEHYGKTHSFVGNADTRILLLGSKDDIYNEVKRCMDIGKKCPGFFMSVGNHIPPNTPIDSCLYYNDFYMQMRKR